MLKAAFYGVFRIGMVLLVSSQFADLSGSACSRTHEIEAGCGLACACSDNSPSGYYFCEPGWDCNDDCYTGELGPTCNQGGN